jgi:hypothetical protein
LVAFEVIQPVWPVVFGAAGFASLVFLRTMARARQQVLSRYDVQREAAAMREEYIANLRAKAQRQARAGGFRA